MLDALIRAAIDERAAQCRFPEGYDDVFSYQKRKDGL